jgi:hypothetical protein
MLAQAQRAIGTNSVDRFVGNLGVVANMKPEVLDKFNGDAWADAYADMLGVDPNLLIGGEQVMMIRDARNQALAAKEQQAAVHQQALIAKDLSQAKTTDPSALTNVIDMFSGYNTP